LPGRWRLVADLEAAGAALLDLATVERIEAGTLHIRRAGDGTAAMLAADTVIVADGQRPERGLADGLGAAGVRVHVVGDCGAIGGIEGANLAAAELAVALG
jgi:2,4-dienoyl-CoA reductase (NADPH2)